MGKKLVYHGGAPTLKASAIQGQLNAVPGDRVESVEVAQKFV